jgi:hypothetical protein
MSLPCRIAAVFFLFALFAPNVPLHADESADSDSLPEKGLALFDGKSLAGWEHIGPGRFVVQDGLLKTDGGMGLLWYKGRKFGDCILRVVYKTTRQQDNSGVYVRIAEPPKDPWYAVHHGYEVQIADAKSGSPYRVSGAVYTFAKAMAKPTRPAGEWNELEITLRGDRISTSLNGVRVADFNPADPAPELSPRGGMGDPEPDPRPNAGYIGLQNHDDNCVVYFKEVSVRPLPEK